MSSLQISKRIVWPYLIGLGLIALTLFMGWTAYKALQTAGPGLNVGGVPAVDGSEEVQAADRKFFSNSSTVSGRPPESIGSDALSTVDRLLTGTKAEEGINPNSLSNSGGLGRFLVANQVGAAPGVVEAGTGELDAIGRFLVASPAEVGTHPADAVEADAIDRYLVVNQSTEMPAAVGAASAEPDALGRFLAAAQPKGFVEADAIDRYLVANQAAESTATMETTAVVGADATEFEVIRPIQTAVQSEAGQFKGASGPDALERYLVANQAVDMPVLAATQAEEGAQSERMIEADVIDRYLRVNREQTR
jgi:hypothetical protein